VIGRVRLVLGDAPSAVRHLGDAVTQAPEDPELSVELANALFRNGEFREAEREVRRTLESAPTLPEAHYAWGLCLERQGQFGLADESFQRAHELDPEAFPLPTRIDRQECLRAVEEAIGKLPDEFRKTLENVSLEVVDLPEETHVRQYDPPMDPCILGLFEGVPNTDKSFFDTPRLPDRILIFQRNLERECRDREELVGEIRITLLHEIGHYLGYDEEQLEELGYD
jgi:predicted Zn-dependent protease with MMP-like domain